MRPGLPLLFASPWTFLGLGLGSGLTPRAPGTAGSLAAIPLYLLWAPWLPLWAVLLLTGLAFALGVAICQKTGEALGVTDHGAIVWDEIAAMWLVLALLPGAGWWWYASGFAAFRFFDVLKPWPIAVVDRRTRGGAGVMADDLLAALYTLAVLWLAATLLP